MKTYNHIIALIVVVLVATVAHAQDTLVVDGRTYKKMIGLVELKAIVMHNNGMLTWKSQYETNQSVIIVERSRDSVTFSKAGTVAAAADTGIHEYRFLDYNQARAASGIIYYRLKLKDKIGNIEYSEPISVAINHPIEAVNK